MSDDSQPKWSWRLPFPRLRYWLRHGHWCTHRYGRAMFINNGMQKRKQCEVCDHVEVWP